MQPELMSLGERAGAALERWQTAYADIRGAGVEVKQVSAHTPNVEIKDIDLRVTAGLSALARLRGADHEQLELIAHRLPSLKTATEAIEAQAKAISGTLSQWQGASTSDQNGHLNLQLSLPEKGSANYDLGAPLVAISQQAASRAAHSRSLATVFLACCKQCRFWVRSLALRVWKAHPRFARHMGNGFFCRQLCGTVPFVSRVRAQGGTR